VSQPASARASPITVSQFLPANMLCLIAFGSRLFRAAT
jgi:hypothetical protein